MENEEGKGQDKVLDRMEKIEEKINKKSEDKLATMSKDKDKEKELEDRVKDNEERMESLRKAGDGTRKKEFMREMKDKICRGNRKETEVFWCGSRNREQGKEGVGQQDNKVFAGQCCSQGQGEIYVSDQ